MPCTCLNSKISIFPFSQNTLKELSTIINICTKWVTSKLIQQPQACIKVPPELFWCLVLADAATYGTQMLLLGWMDVAELMSVFGKRRRNKKMLILIKVISSVSFNLLENVAAKMLPRHEKPPQITTSDNEAEDFCVRTVSGKWLLWSI